MPFPIGFGALAATLNFIPIVGPIVMIVILAVVGVVTGASLGVGLLPAALFMLVVFVEGQFITPAIIGRRLEINSLAVLLSLLFWTWMWGPMAPVVAASDRRPDPREISAADRASGWRPAKGGSEPRRRRQALPSRPDPDSPRRRAGAHRRFGPPASLR